MYVRFLNLRKKLIGNYKDFIRIFFGIDYSENDRGQVIPGCPGTQVEVKVRETFYTIF
jgi:hypothetical protein